MNTIVAKTIMEYIESHLEEDLTLEKLADITNYSKFYLARIFKENTGTTIYKYVQKRRLFAAAKQLADTDQPIIQIACKYGYSSQQAFTQAFGKLFGVTPKIYRENRQNASHTGEGRMAA